MSVKKTTKIVPYSTDGFGHQLQGLFSTLILHGINNYYIDGVSYIKIQKKFGHFINVSSCKNYLEEIVRLFNEYFCIEESKYTKFINYHEIYCVPKIVTGDTLCIIDNAYYFGRIEMNENEQKKHRENIEIVKKFALNKFLPISNMDDNNIVIHIRLGDAMGTCREESIKCHNKKIIILLEKFKDKYPDYTYYIHSDGNIEFLQNKMKELCLMYKVKDKNCDILEVISDFINTKILVTSNSSLSKVCTFFGEKTLCIVNDDNKHSVSDSSIRISDYLARTTTRTRSIWDIKVENIVSNSLLIS